MTYNVLVVDDDSLFRRALPRMFKSIINCNVTTVDNGLEAVGLVAGDSYQFVLMDTDLGDDPKKGFEYVTEMRRYNDRLWHFVAIIGMSGNKDYEPQWLEKGANGFLHKPFEEKNLRIALMRAYNLLELKY
jgi:CheY-like chemotaxis protein